MKKKLPPEPDGGFDAHTEFLALLKEAETSRRRPYRASKLDPYTSRLLALRAEGATPAHLQRWLRKARKLEVSISTVKRWLAKHPNQVQQ